MGLLNSYSAAAMISGAGQAGQAALASQQQFNQQSDLEAQRSQAQVNLAQVTADLQTKENVRHEANAPVVAGATTAAVDTANAASAASVLSAKNTTIANAQAPLDQAVQLQKINAALPQGTTPYTSLDAATADGKTAPALTADESNANFIQASVKSGYVTGAEMLTNLTKEQLNQVKAASAAAYAQSRVDVANIRAESAQMMATVVAGNHGATDARLEAAGKVEGFLKLASEANTAITNDQKVLDTAGIDPTSKTYTDAQADIASQRSQRDGASTAARLMMGVAGAAAVPAPAPAPSGAPAPGTVVQGMKFIGGDPNSKSSWTTAPSGSSAPAAPAPASVAPPAASTASSTPAPQAAAVDSARAQLAAADAKLGSYGLMKRGTDPTGFAAAQQARAAAQKSVDDAMASYQASLGGSATGAVFARPGLR